MAEDIQFELDKEKYLQIFNSQGLRAALTEIHKDMWEYEFDSFEGPKGYRPDQWERIKKYRDLSRDLWDMVEADRKRQLGIKV